MRKEELEKIENIIATSLRRSLIEKIQEVRIKEKGCECFNRALDFIENYLLKILDEKTLKERKRYLKTLGIFCDVPIIYNLKKNTKFRFK